MLSECLMSDFQKSLLWRTTGGKALSGWPEETLQRHPQSISEGFRHTDEVLGIDCTGAIKVTKEQLSMKKKENL